MPQLDFSTFPNQIFWLLVTLVVLYFILAKIALPRLAGILADRQGRITSDLEMAARLKDQAQEAEKAYQQALVDARTEAGKIVAAARAEIQADLDKATAKADAEIAARAAESAKRIDEIRAGAVASVSDVAKDTAEAIVAALGGKADAKSVAAAVAARMKG
ncbi:F0F1 ATP synthase subunit B' [Frigidibacter sp. SD6-1]|uniref:F0F1 ATP synthase subunit B' n=1 Tax=Frigidibacter sp. SD6-1 TaxID=3032581 RepID=UPI0024DF7EC0|nr:F0F1 ATP synthase subunit B' [Frigidibacter sp. SD6-1]